MEFIKIEHFQHFDDETVFYAEVSGLPENIQVAARRMDGAEYDPKGFGVCVGYDGATGKLSVSRDRDPATGENGNLYYVDKDGDYRWFEAEITEELTKRIFAACGKILAKERPSALDRLAAAKDAAAAAEKPPAPKTKKLDAEL